MNVKNECNKKKINVNERITKGEWKLTPSNKLSVAYIY